MDSKSPELLVSSPMRRVASTIQRDSGRMHSPRPRRNENWPRDPRSHALHAAGSRVREIVDMVGRLGNASKGERTVAYSVSPKMETGFGKTRGALVSAGFVQ
ncbi:hypothetical protein TNCV_1286571 [Trichonephila clavipes]|nr:hypothetical protein TNCV_1286571 [Trichonephila clavipes]